MVVASILIVLISKKGTNMRVEQRRRRALRNMDGNTVAFPPLFSILWSLESFSDHLLLRLWSFIGYISPNSDSHDLQPCSQMPSGSTVQPSVASHSPSIIHSIKVSKSGTCRRSSLNVLTHKWVLGSQDMRKRGFGGYSRKRLSTISMSAISGA